MIPEELGDEIGEDELAALALAADPDVALGDDAVPLAQFLGADAGPIGGGLLPGWYMPAAVGLASGPLRGWRRRLALVVIASFVLINAYGLCSTYGHVGFG